MQQDRINPQQQREWAERVVRAINALFPADPEEQVDTWPQCLRYLEQVQACDRLSQQHHLQLPEAAELLNRAGIYLREHAFYSLAESLFQRALATLGDDWAPSISRSPLLSTTWTFSTKSKADTRRPNRCICERYRSGNRFW